MTIKELISKLQDMPQDANAAEIYFFELLRNECCTGCVNEHNEPGYDCKNCARMNCDRYLKREWKL